MADVPLENERITSEALSDEMVARYAEAGYSLVFAEDVMRRNLREATPEIALPPGVSTLTWAPDSVGRFYAAYTASFRERPGFPRWSEVRWVDWIADDPTFRSDLSWVALAGGEAVGFIANADEEQDQERQGLIVQVGTHPEWRGGGIASALIARSLRAWQAEGKAAALLHVNINNPGARRLYERLGFVVIGRRGAFQRGVAGTDRIDL